MKSKAAPASIKVVIEKYWDKIACAYSLNEGGRVMVKDGKVQYVGIQASEKVSYNVTVTATGPSGHASMPRPDNAVVHLAAAIQKLGTYQVPADPNTIVRRYFEQLAKIEPDDEIAKWMRALEQPERVDLGGEASLRTKPHVELHAARLDHAHHVAGGRPGQRHSFGGNGELERAHASGSFDQ